MTKMEMKAGNLNKWMHQNKAEYTGEFFEGSLLDNFIVSTKRGYAAVYERYVNPNASCYEIMFAPYKDMKSVDKLFSDFIEISESIA